jgi:hypothetical protein
LDERISQKIDRGRFLQVFIDDKPASANRFEEPLIEECKPADHADRGNGE